jgi:hypothetical protein
VTPADSSFLPAPLWLITTLHVVTLTLHLIAMNFVFGGTAAALLGRAGAGGRDPAIARIIQLLPTGVAATVTLGVAPLLFLQLVYYRQAYSAAIVSGWPWLLIVAAVILAYYLLYAAAFATGRGSSRVSVPLALALLCLLYVSWVYSSVFSLAERPDLYARVYAANQSGWTANPDIVGLLCKDSAPVFRLGRRLFLWGMVSAMIVGVVYLLTLGGSLRPLMRSPAIWVLAVAIVLSLGSIHLYFKRRFAAAGVSLGLSVLGMVVVRHTLRLLVLEGVFDPSTLRVSPQWDVFAIFLVFFVVALGTVTYMLRLFLRGSPAG